MDENTIIGNGQKPNENVVNFAYSFGLSFCVNEVNKLKFCLFILKKHFYQLLSIFRKLWYKHHTVERKNTKK